MNPHWPLRALLLAAGRGARLRPLTDATPKPLLRAGGRSLIEWQIGALARAGVGELFVNLAHLGMQIESELGDGARYGVRIRYLHEGTHAEAALETLGGIVNALDHLGRRPFIVASSDLVTDFDYATLAPAALDLAHDRFDAHLVLVDNPPHHPRGDLGFDGLRATRTAPLLNYAGIGVFAPHLFAGLAPSRQPLFPWLYQFVERGRISAQHHRGAWHNVGTPAQLAALDHELSRGGAPAARSP